MSKLQLISTIHFTHSRRCQHKVLWAFFLFLSLLFILPQSYGAVENDNLNIQSQFRLYLPGHWQIQKFNIDESENIGSSNYPVIRHLFTSRILLLEDTYVLDRKEGSVSLVSPVAKAGKEIIIHGIALSAKGNDFWQTEISLQNDLTKKMGRPLTSFNGKVIAHGSTEEEIYYQAIKKNQLHSRKRKALAQLTLNLPGYYEVSTFFLNHNALEYMVDDGTEQVIEQGFTANIKLTRDTYKITEQLEHVTLLKLISKTGDKWTIKGKIKTIISEGSQSTFIIYDKHVMKDKGIPIDFYPKPVLIEGTSKTRKYLTHLHEQILISRQRQKELEKANIQLELSRTIFANKIEEKKQRKSTEKQRQAMITEAEKKGFIEKQIEQLKTNLKNSNSSLWLYWFKKTIKNDDPRKQNLALASFLEKYRKINGVISYEKSNGVIGPFKIKITQIDLITYKFKGEFCMIGKKGIIRGQLRGTNIYVYCSELHDNHYKNNSPSEFSFTAILDKDNMTMSTNVGITTGPSGWYSDNKSLVINLL
ncbi:hypothetical protein [Desulfogranum marinum]|uniref:hypothetical protein n=1 Tax=Desulfogranum marinum TaxID=453220 RepID=UPI0019633783|nr:hypothetical protein [Desulfogranum marinum]MBM9514878.1 hypothetical protein [Desulfogranum marinum]